MITNGRIIKRSISPKSLDNEDPSIFAALSSSSAVINKKKANTDNPPKIQYTFSHVDDFGLSLSINKLNKILPKSTPIIKVPSSNPIKLECSFMSLVIKPIVANTDTLIKAKEIPTVKKSNLKCQKLSAKGMINDITLTNAKAISIAFL